MNKHPQIGKTYRSPINVMGTDIESFNIPDLGVRIDNVVIGQREDEIQPVLSYQARELERTWELLYMKMGLYVTGLSIGIFSHCWLSDYIYDEDGKEVWRKPGTISVIIDKEGDPSVKDKTPSAMATLMVDVSLHISRFYPRVLVYHYIGLLLLRTPTVGIELNGEILLNFFKTVELITASRKGAKPKLKNIFAVCEELKSGYSASEIKEFWKIRSRDAAHDYQNARSVDRRIAVDCKLWAEELIINDLIDRGTQIVKRQ